MCGSKTWHVMNFQAWLVDNPDAATLPPAHAKWLQTKLPRADFSKMRTCFTEHGEYDYDRATFQRLCGDQASAEPHYLVVVAQLVTVRRCRLNTSG